MFRSRLTPILVFFASVLTLAAAGLAAEPAADVATAADARVALVIGNGAYEDAPLRNPVNDARAMAEALRGAGFEVIYGQDLNQRQMQRAISEFGRKIKPGGVALFFFAGHGMQVRGQNFIIPIGAELKSEPDVRLEAINVEVVMDQVTAARSRVNFMVLDACRNNPFERRFRGSPAGLASIDAPEGTLIAYATAPGKVASDGAGANGLYTSELLKAIRSPGLRVEDVFKQTRSRVSRQTNGEQVPWEASSLTGDFYFSPPADKPAESSTTAPSAPAAPQVMVQLGSTPNRNVPSETSIYELSFWESIKGSDNPADYQAYLEAFPNGRFAPLARLRAERSPGAETVARNQMQLVDGIEIESIEAEYVAASAASIREKPNAESKRLGGLKAGDPILVAGKVKGTNWLRVLPENGMPGFVWGELLTRTVAPATPPPSAAPSGQIGSLRPPAPVKPAVGVFPPAPPKPGDVFRDCSLCPELVALAPGAFEMGSDEFYAFEKPRHRVTLAKPFAIGRREVTFAEWDACVEAKGCNYRPDDRGLGRGDRPVTDVSWADTKVYLAWLSRTTGQSYRLPTEAEWEYAARAGTQSAYWWGNDIGRDRANCRGCGDTAGGRTMPVGRFPANPFGLFDVAGNAAEWVEDCWSESYQGASTDGSARARAQCTERVLRGGAFGNDPRYLRSAARFKYDSNVRYVAHGFRVVRELP
jgi:formylglycine-generating enzyme required for sulfatase activity